MFNFRPPFCSSSLRWAAVRAAQIAEQRFEIARQDAGAGDQNIVMAGPA